MTSLNKPPTFRSEDFTFDELKDTYFGKLLLAFNPNIEAWSESVQVLSENSAQEVWACTFVDARHKFEIDASNWTFGLSWNASGDWIDFYNSGNWEPVEDQIRSLLDPPNDQAVVFIKGPLECILTN